MFSAASDRLPRATESQGQASLFAATAGPQQTTFAVLTTPIVLQSIAMFIVTASTLRNVTEESIFKQREQRPEGML